MTNKEIIEEVAQESRVVVYGAFSNEPTRILELARTDEREKCLKVLSDKMHELNLRFFALYDKTYQERSTVTIPEVQNQMAMIADVMQKIRDESAPLLNEATT